MGLSGEDKMAYDCGKLLAVADAIERWALRTKRRTVKISGLPQLCDTIQDFRRNHAIRGN